MKNYTVHKHPHPTFDAYTIEKAFDAPRAGYVEYPRVNTHNELCGSGALLYLMLCERNHPGTQSANGEKAIDRIVSSLRYMLLPGNEPSMRVGPYWGYPLTASILTLLKKTPSMWNLFSEQEHARMDDIMKCFVVQCAWATNDCNDFWTGPEMKGNYRKGWNPNHRSPSVLPIMYATIYFDSVDYVNHLLTSFSFDEFTTHLKAIGFENAYKTMMTAGKSLMEEGGEAFLLDSNEPAGKGAGVKHPYVYRNIPLSDTLGLINEILLQNCQGGKVVDCVGDRESGICGYVMKGSSPVLGLDGMMSEFTSHDAKGIRSDITYCAANFCILAPVLATLVELGIWNPEDPQNSEAATKTAISTIDFLYKIQNGYYSFSHGKGRPTDEKSTHGVYPFAKDLWNAMLA